MILFYDHLKWMVITDDTNLLITGNTVGPLTYVVQRPSKENGRVEEKLHCCFHIWQHS